MKGVNVNIAVLRLFASFGVICLHTFGAQATLVDDVCSYIIWYAFAFAIPIFFSTSGYFSLNKKSDCKNVYKKILNIFIFLLAWGVLYTVSQILVQMLIGKKIHVAFLLTEPLKLVMLSLVQEGFFSRFWFFGAFMIVLAITPFFSKIFKKTKGAIISTIVLSVISLLSNIANYIYIYIYNASIYSYEENPWFRQTFKIWIFMMYFAWGGLLAKEEVKVFIKRILPKKQYAILVFVIFSIISVVHQFWIGKYMERNSPEYWHDSPIVIIQVVMLLVINTTYNEKISKNRIIHVIAENGLGIYALHTIVQKILLKIIEPSSFLNLCILSLLIFLLSFVGATILNRIPILKILVNLNGIGWRRKRG